MVAEHGSSEQISERILEAPKISSKDRNLQGTVEQIPDVLVPEMVEQLVKLLKTISVDRILQRIAERIVDIPVPQDVEELVEISRVPQDRIQQRFVEQTDETPDISFAEKNCWEACHSDARKHATGREHACSARRPTVAVHRQGR